MFRLLVNAYVANLYYANTVRIVINLFPFKKFIKITISIIFGCYNRQNIIFVVTNSYERLIYLTCMPYERL